jgi:hypothetical protein
MTQQRDRLDMLAASGPRVLTETLAAATGREQRSDPVVGRTGGPAGNARTTAWTGLVLLVLIAVEMVTLLAIRQLISWHIAVGVLLVPPALLKTASTGWRIVRYYTGSAPYRDAGPPPLLLRALGPLVVLTTLAVLGSGVTLVALGPDRTHDVLLTFAGFRVDALTVHQASFVVWAVVTGAHLLARFVPALRVVTSRSGHGSVRGGVLRAASVLGALLVGGAVAAYVLGAATDWTSGFGSRGHDVRDYHVSSDE